MRSPRWIPALAACGALACSGADATDTGSSPTATEPSATTCVGGQAIVTDIDETLTTLDSEWIAQIADPTHDPAMRPDADALLTAYADKGYAIFYVTARGQDIALSDGRDATEATSDWLDAHGFPRAEGDLFLAEGIGVTGDAAVTYKSATVDGLQDAGWAFAWAYGNADTDTLAYQAAGIPDAQIFLVGKLAGTMGVTGIPDEDAYTQHLADFLPTVVAATGCP